MQKQLSSDVIINHLRNSAKKPPLFVVIIFFFLIFQMILIVIKHAFLPDIMTVFWIPHSHILSRFIFILSDLLRADSKSDMIY